MQFTVAGNDSPASAYPGSLLRLRRVVAAGDSAAFKRQLAEEFIGGETLGKRVEEIEAAILAWHRDNESSRRLASVPGIGPITASAIVATVGDASSFSSARHFAAWIGLVPKQNSSGGMQ